MNGNSGWNVQQLTHGSADGICHTHAYYDIPVFDPTGSRIVGHRVDFSGRHPEPSDSIEIGVVDLEHERRWQPIGTSRAWSWQQGAMSQWLPTGTTAIWNDREGDRFIARSLDLATGEERQLPLPIYAIHPAGDRALSLDMARLQHLRPGYGYAGGSGARIDRRHPEDDGVHMLDLESGEHRLLLSLDRAVRFMLKHLPLRQRLKHSLRKYTYWFNHAKFSPTGQRFTVKLRFRERGEGWNETQGVSLTCGSDGSDLHLLTDATSHVMWLDEDRLYLWRGDGLYLYADDAPRGTCVEHIAPALIDSNVHARHFADRPELFVFDTPYREEIDLVLLDRTSGGHRVISRFENHRPKTGPFRCDLHPCPSPDGRRMVVTSLQDGGRQIYLLEAA